MSGKMNTERLLVRGKCRLTGMWIIGNYYLKDAIDHAIIKEHGRWPCHIVHEETLGQFSEHTDKNGQRIFEGDIVKHPNGKKSLVVWRAGRFQYQKRYVGGGYVWELIFSKYVEVVGNIHDNPELEKECIL